MSSGDASQPQQKTEFEELEKPIKEIIALVNKFDDKYREKCFEILLNLYLRRKFETITIAPDEKTPEKDTEAIHKEFLLPIDVRAFLTQNSIPEEIIGKLFLIDKEEIRPIYKITTTKKATAQIQIALLSALENAIKKQGNKFEFSMENVRKLCNSYNVYDIGNFKTHFKNNSKLFKGLDEEEHVELSPEGQTELAEVMTTVAK
jgi:molybdopterin converting factor small subunit